MGAQQLTGSIARPKKLGDNKDESRKAGISKSSYSPPVNACNSIKSSIDYIYFV